MSSLLEFLRDCIECGKELLDIIFEDNDEDVCRICKYGEKSIKGKKAKAMLNFHKRIAELGGKVIGKYIGKDIQVECVCKEGHTCLPMPNNIRRGQGMCRTCAGQDPVTAKANFHKRIIEFGGKVIGEYTDKDTPVECICKEGHECKPRPGHIQQGEGMCSSCAGNNQAFAKPIFTNE